MKKNWIVENDGTNISLWHILHDFILAFIFMQRRKRVFISLLINYSSHFNSFHFIKFKNIPNAELSVALVHGYCRYFIVSFRSFLLSVVSRDTKQGHCIPYWIQIVIESRPYNNSRHCIKHCLLSLCHLSNLFLFFFFCFCCCVCSVCMLWQWKLFSEAS